MSWSSSWGWACSSGLASSSGFGSWSGWDSSTLTCSSSTLISNWALAPSSGLASSSTLISNWALAPSSGLASSSGLACSSILASSSGLACSSGLASSSGWACWIEVPCFLAFSSSICFLSLSFSSVIWLILAEISAIFPSSSLTLLSGVVFSTFPSCLTNVSTFDTYLLSIVLISFFLGSEVSPPTHWS